MPQQQGSLISNSSFQQPDDSKQKLLPYALGAGVAAIGGTYKLGEHLDNKAYGRQAISQTVADKWIQRNMPDLDVNARSSQPVVQYVRDLFHPDQKVRDAALSEIKQMKSGALATRGRMTDNLYGILNQAAYDGRRWANAKPDINQNALHTEMAAEAFAKEAAAKQSRLTGIGRDIFDDKAWGKWQKDIKRGGTSPKPPFSTWEYNPGSPPTEVIGNTTAKREAQVGSQRPRPTLEAAAVRGQLLSENFANSPTGKIMQGIQSMKQGIGNFTDRLIPEVYRGTPKGTAIKSIGGLGLASIGGMGIYKGAQIAGSKAADAAKVQDKKDYNTALDTPESGIQGAAQDAQTAANLKSALADYEWNVKMGIPASPSLISRLEQKRGLPQGTLLKFVSKQGK